MFNQFSSVAQSCPTLQPHGLHLTVSIVFPSIFHEMIRSDQISHSVVSDTLRPHESQHARPPCPSPTPGACSNSCPSSWWCHPTISSSVVLYSSCLQSFPASEYIIRHHKCGKWILPQAVCEQSEDKALGSRKDFSGRHGILFYIRG